MSRLPSLGSLTTCGVLPCHARVGRRSKQNARESFDLRALCSGDVLLSHGLSPYYHRGCSVSLPCSEWERVVPLRYCHQSAEPHWWLPDFAAKRARDRISGDTIGVGRGGRPTHGFPRAIKHTPNGRF